MWLEWALQGCKYSYQRMKTDLNFLHFLASLAVWPPYVTPLVCTEFLRGAVFHGATIIQSILIKSLCPFSKLEEQETIWSNLNKVNTPLITKKMLGVCFSKPPYGSSSQSITGFNPAVWIDARIPEHFSQYGLLWVKTGKLDGEHSKVWMYSVGAGRLRWFSFGHPMKSAYLAVRVSLIQRTLRAYRSPARR